MKKVIIYQLFTRLFGNQTESLKPNGTLQENGSGKMNDITPQALKSIRDLGCTHVWYTGIIEHATATDYTQYGIKKDNPYIVKGIAGSPYAIKDYYDVDPDLAVDVRNRISEFEELVKRTHQAKMKVIIDFVPNHVARQYKSDAKPNGISDLGENDNNKVYFSPQNNFYYIPNQAFQPHLYIGEGEDRYVEFPAKVTGNDCFGAYPGSNDWYETVKLNYGVDYLHGHHGHFNPIPDTWLKMKEILSFWASKGVDGFRCDMAEMVPVEFWGWVIPEIKKEYPDVCFIAEIYNRHIYRYYIFEGKFDYLYDKVGMYDLLRSIMQGHASASQITSLWQIKEDILPYMLKFLENHDEQRIASDFFVGEAEKGIPAMVISTFMDTAPTMIYFGQELGERGMDQEGFSGYDGRTTIFDYWSVNTIRRWNNNGQYNTNRLTKAERELRQQYKKILTLANKEKAISDGQFFDLMYVNMDNTHMDTYHQYAFMRKQADELLIIAVNFAPYSVHSGIKIPQHAFDLWQIPITEKTSFTELFNNPKEEIEKTLSPYQLFETHIPKWGAVVWKTKLNKK